MPRSGVRSPHGPHKEECMSFMADYGDEDPPQYDWKEELKSFLSATLVIAIVLLVVNVLYS
jgi:hypothetical protein